MYILCDIGNSRMKVAVFEASSHIPIYYKAHNHNIKELINILNEIKENFKIDRVVYSSVAFNINDMFIDAVKNIFKLDAYKITHKDIKLKDNLYTPKNSVGIDRLLSTYASICLENKINSENKYASIVVDMGTATTISVMLSDFVFIGGMIMSGTKTSYRALSNKTSLPYYEIGQINEIPSPLNTNVKNALVSGAIYNTIGSITYSIDEIKKYIKEKYNIKSYVFLTGGISNLKLLKCKVYPYLVLQGIYFNLNNST